MTSPARHSAANASAHGGIDSHASYASQDFFPGERLGPERAGTRGKAWRRGASLILIALGGGWAMYGDPSVVTGLLAALTAVVPAITDQKTPGSIAPPAPAVASAIPTCNPPALSRPRNLPPPTWLQRLCSHWLRPT